MFESLIRPIVVMITGANTTLLEAAKGGDVEKMQKALQKGADINFKDDKG